MDNDFNRNETWNVLPSGQTAEESRQQFKQEAEDDVIDSVFGDIFDAKEQQLSQGLIARSEANPSKYISARKTAEALGVDDVDLVYDNLDEFQQQWKEQEKAKYIKRCDNLKEMCIEDDSFLSRIDDVSAGQLARINDNIAIFGQAEAKKGLGGFIKKAKYAYNRTDREQDRNELAYNAMFADGEDKAVLEQRLAEYEDLYGDMPEIDTSGYGISDFAYAGIGQLPNQIQSVGSVAAGTLGGAAVGAGVGSAVPVLGTAAGGVAGAKIGAAAGWARAGYLIYKQEAGSMSLEMRKLKDANGNGFDDDTIKTISCLYGALSAGIEYIPASKMLNTIPGFKNITTKGLKKAIKEAVKDKTKVEILKEIGRDYIKAVAAETAEETVQQATQSSLLRYAKATANEQGMDFEQNAILDDVIEAANAGVQGFKGTALLPLGTSGARVYTDLRAYNKANEIRQLKQGKEVKAKYDAAVLDDTQKKVQEYAQSPAGEVATIKALFQKAKRSSIYRDIFMTAEDAKAVLLSEAVQKNKETLDKAGFIAEIERQIAQSAELGTPVRIGMDVYASTVMPSPELYAAFKDVVTTYADGITINEIKAKEQARANFLAEGQKRKERRKSDYELAYKTILDKMTVGGVSQEQRSKMAEFHAQLALYFTDNGQMTIGEYLQRFSADFDRSFDGAIDGGANVANVLAAVRESAANNEVANLINKSKVVAKKDINAIRKALMKQIESPNMSDVRKYIQVMNAISDMRLNIEGMSDDDIIRQLANYTKSGELKLDIERNDADRTRSGIFSASEKALSDIQADGANSDYVLVGGGRVPVNYEIVDLDDMITSHDATGAVNEAYPQELQPRDRSRSASDAQIAEIVNSFAPERVARAEIATEGAPIITKDGFVAVGNGRAMAIGQVYNHPEKVQAYQKYLTDKGYDINGVAKPVLVRRLALDLDAGQLKALVDDANTAGTMQYSDSENALRDAAKMSGNLLDLLDLDADIDSAANKRFLNGFFAEVVPTSERNAYLDKDDKITRKGVERVENAIVAKLLPDARFLSVLVENPDNNIRKVTRALAKAAPIIIALENDIAAGRISADYSLAQDVAKAVELLKRAKDKNMPVADFLQMQDMFADPIDASTQIMVRLFSNSASAAEFANKMKNYAHGAEVQGDQMQGSMFGMETLNKTQLLERELEEQRLFQGQIADSGALSIDTKEEMQGLSDEEFKAKMLETLKGLKGKKIYNTSLSGDIEIRTSSIKKYKSFFADKNKRLIVPYIPELLGKARFVSENTYTPETESNIIAYWKADLPISIDSNSFNVHLTVKQDNNGNLFWDAQVQEKAPRTDPATNPGDKGLTSEISEDAISITPSAENVNKTFYQLPESAYKNGKADINSDAFKQWFGKSQVTTQGQGYGEPLKVYHGTDYNFDTFDMRGGIDFPDAAYFSSKKSVAKTYTNTGNIIEVYLKIENPYVVDAEGKSYNDFYDHLVSDMDYAARNGHDGVIIRNIRDDWGQRGRGGAKADTYVVFEPNQIKSTSNKGTFNPNDNRIYYQSKISDEQLEADLAEFDKILDSFADENKEYYSKKGKFEDAKKIQKKYKDFFMYNIADASISTGLHDPFYFEYDGQKDITNIWIPKKLEKNSNIILYRGAEQISIPVNKFEKSKFKKLGFKRQKLYDEGMRDVYTLNKEEKSDDVRDFARKNGKYIRKANVYFQSAFAGSRVDYDEPSLEAIGSGEGNQAHGWGLYYALDKNIAESYRDMFFRSQGGSTALMIRGKTLGSFFNEISGFIGYYDSAIELLVDNRDMDPKEYIIKALDEYIKDYKDFYRKYEDDVFKVNYEKAERIRQNAETLDKNDFTFKEYGQVHEVDLPESPYLLDEQKDYNEQSKFVRDALIKLSENEDLGKSLNEAALRKLAKDDNFVGSTSKNYSTYYGERAYLYGKEKAIKDIQHDFSDPELEFMRKALLDFINNLNLDDITTKNELKGTGGKIYRDLVKILGSDKAASEMLKKYGIKGITYDGRQDGRCFVIFNPKDVKVIQKFYQNQKVGMEALGAYTPLNRKITLFRNHNLSTLIHESGHYWLDMMDVFSKMPNATERLKSDYKIIKDWLGVGEDGIITDGQHEQFARGVERYFLEHHAPSSKLANIFDTFRRWLSTVYSDVRELDVELNDDVVRVFDHMLASEAEIEEYRQANQIKAMFEHADDFGMSDADFEKYKELAENSLTLAQNKHFNDKIILIHREQTEEYEKEKAKITKQTLFEWCEDKQNKAVYALFRGGKDTIGVPEIAINTKDMQEIFGDRLSELPKRNNEPIYEDNGIRFVDAAEFLGLSADQLKAAILTARQRMRNYKRELDRRVHENLGSPISYDDVEKQVVASLYNDKRANLLRMELSALSDGKRKQTVTEQAFIAYARA